MMGKSNLKKWFYCYCVVVIVILIIIALENGSVRLHIGNCFYAIKDYDNALNWYYKASERSNALAKNKIGYMYLNGEGVESDGLQAAIWYRLAAECGDAESQLMVGKFYEQGEYVERDDELAEYWYRQAAAQGFELATERMSVISDE